MATEEPSLLTELCLICHINPPRYRCPRCALRTCSLPCARRHKAWSRCSGLRHPAPFLSRRDLATAASLDRDYNFLAGLERHLDRVERDVEERGIPIEPTHGPRHGPKRRPKGEWRVTAAIERCRVIVQKAPVGMQRQRENRTGWNKKRKCLNWTIEWFDDTDHRLLDIAPATAPLQEAYERARAQPKPDGDHLAPSETRLLPASRDPSEAQPTSSPTAPAIGRTSYFYLLRPHTPLPTRVVIPLSPQSTIADSLYERLVLEYPTFYVLPSPPDALPDGFLTEECYLQQQVHAMTAAGANI
ncbi:MAG: hypothetical protein M1826_005290 [Phylliscum demangeonii]|nr:MAG: hypothetical protein M1826_005290 [Phylliscum demangeonii]